MKKFTIFYKSEHFQEEIAEIDLGMDDIVILFELVYLL
jgi:hypothetical protein